jgi:hypothetical protein
MEGGLYCPGRKDFVDFFSYVPPSCLAGISQVLPKAKSTDVVRALRFSKVGKEIRRIFPNVSLFFHNARILFTKV